MFIGMAVYSRGKCGSFQVKLVSSMYSQYLLKEGKENQCALRYETLT
ncbi:MAG: hypothetical protein NVSMB44_02110 [Ktedonobacteraceae bacterium]